MKTHVLFLVFALTASLLMSCEDGEEVAVGPEAEAEFNPVLKQGNTYYYRNWNLDQSNAIDSSTEWKSTLRVVAQGQSVGGFDDAFVLIDSSFSLDGTFLEADSVYIRIDEKKDVYFLGFVAGLAEDFVRLEPTWNRLFAFSAGLGNSWTILSIDTTVEVSGFPTPLTLTLSLTGTLDGLETVDVPAGLIDAYKVKIHLEGQVGPLPITLDISFWFSDNPTAIVKQFQQSITILEFIAGTQTELESYTLAP